MCLGIRKCSNYVSVLGVYYIVRVRSRLTSRNVRYSKLLGSEKRTGRPSWRVRVCLRSAGDRGVHSEDLTDSVHYRCD